MTSESRKLVEADGPKRGYSPEKHTDYHGIGAHGARGETARRTADHHKPRELHNEAAVVPKVNLDRGQTAVIKKVVAATRWPLPGA